MNILVTGATGFIGRSLVGKLCSLRHNVKILTRNKQKAERLFNKQLKIVETDICDEAALAEKADEFKNTEIVYHLAASLQRAANYKDLFLINTLAAKNVFILSRKNGVKSFIFTSSIEASGTASLQNIPIQENDVCRPAGRYGLSKLKAEQVLKDLSSTDIDLIIFRLGNVYGPGAGNLITAISDLMLKKNKIFYFLSKLRDRYVHPIFLDDVVEALLIPLKQPVNNTYFVAGREYVKVMSLITIIAEKLNRSVLLKKKIWLFDEMCLFLRRIKDVVMNKSDIVTYINSGWYPKIHRAYSIKNIRQELGFTPKVELQEGIDQTLQWAIKEGLLKI